MVKLQRSQSQTGTGTSLTITTALEEDKTAYRRRGGNQNGMISGVMLRDASSVRKKCKTNNDFMS